ncbi:MAG: aspartate carbamoyltransferase [Gammaproteobacteria bacterium]
MLKNILYQKDILSTKDITLEKLQLILDTAVNAEALAKAGPIQNKIIAHCFFEPSTRTRLSFETAALRLGAKTIGFSSSDGLSLQKGETLEDTIRIIDGYADLIIIRHPESGSAEIAADIANCPVINAGDGANQHPTQALLDIFTIQQSQGKINSLSVALVGDLEYSRTIHSLLDLLKLYDVQLHTPSTQQALEEIMPQLDILYMTRIQQERRTELLKNPFYINKSLLKKVKSNFKILHPLPRINELSTDIDNTPYAYYFQQAQNGVAIRQALLTLLLKNDLGDS